MKRVWRILGAKLSVPVWAFVALIVLAIMGIVAQASDDEESVRQVTADVTTTPPPTRTEPTTTLPTTTTTRTAAGLGSTISLAGFGSERMEVTLVKIVDPAPAQQYDRPRKGRYVSVQLRLSNTGPEVYEDSPSNGAKLIDQDDQVHSSTIVNSAAGQGFGGSVTIPPGQSRLGFITFDVPTTAKLSKFEFALSSGFAPQTGQWAIG